MGKKKRKKKKVKVPKVRRKWIRNPVQQVVPNRKKPKRADAKKEIEEGKQESEE